MATRSSTRGFRRGGALTHHGQTAGQRPVRAPVDILAVEPDRPLAGFEQPGTGVLTGSTCRRRSGRSPR